MSTMLRKVPFNLVDFSMIFTLVFAQDEALMWKSVQTTQSENNCCEEYAAIFTYDRFGLEGKK